MQTKALHFDIRGCVMIRGGGAGSGTAPGPGGVFRSRLRAVQVVRDAEIRSIHGPGLLLASTGVLRRVKRGAR